MTNKTLQSFLDKMFVWVASWVSSQMRKGKLRERVWPYYSTAEQPPRLCSSHHKAQALWMGTTIHNLSSDPCSDHTSPPPAQGQSYNEAHWQLARLII